MLQTASKSVSLNFGSKLVQINNRKKLFTLFQLNKISKQSNIINILHTHWKSNGLVTLQMFHSSMYSMAEQW